MNVLFHFIFISWWLVVPCAARISFALVLLSLMSEREQTVLAINWPMTLQETYNIRFAYRI